MKMNKVAAGALALALGLGAIAPSVASETKSNYTGAQLFLERYEKQLKEVNELRDRAIVAQERIDAAKAATKKANEEYEAARKAFDALFPGWAKAGTTDVTYEEIAKRPVSEALVDLNKLGTTLIFQDLVNNYKPEKDAAGNVTKSAAEHLRSVLEGRYKSQVKSVNEQATTVIPTEAQVRIDRVVRAYVEYVSDTTEGSEKQLAFLRLEAAAAAKQAAEINEKDVVAKEQKHVKKYDEKLTELTNAARGYGYVVQIGNNGIKLVKDGEGKIQAPGKTDIARLKEVKEQAQKTLDAAKLIIKNWPETVKNVRSELDALIAKQEKNIAEAEKRIAASKKMALVSTAYADELEDKSDDALIEDMLSTDKDINDKLDANEKEAKEENEKKPEDKKPEDKKPEEKKPEANKPAKQAGNNVKTGVAGIAGVAGILAAASVAYAASKRD